MMNAATISPAATWDTLPWAETYTPSNCEWAVAVKRAACDLHGLTMAQLVGPSRVRSIAHVRMAAMGALYNRSSMSSPQVGRTFGNRDHTTVLHAVNWRKASLENRRMADRIEAHACALVRAEATRRGAIWQ